MPGRGAFFFSFALHLAIAALLLTHIRLFESKLPEETPLVVELVNVAPKTHATERTVTPPEPRKPVKVAEKEPEPKPEKKPEPPKPQPPKPPPPPPEPKPPEPKPPEPKPAPPKPAPPKPPEPKPAPPKPVPPPPKPEVKPRPPALQKKSEDSAFDALLKNLARRQYADNERQTKTKPAPPARQRASSQPIAPLGARLTTSEIDLVRQQIEQCWNVPAGARDAENLRPEFKIYMNPDGTVRSATLVNSDRLGDPFFRAAADSARRAILNANCHGPLKLPPDKYDGINGWNTIDMMFNPKDVT